MVCFETPVWRVSLDRCGFFTLTRLADGASAFFQADDDCETWHTNLDRLWRLDNHGKRAEAFNMVCGSYSDLLS